MKQSQNLLTRWQYFLFKPVDVSTLAIFRIIFGLAMAYQAFVIFGPRFVQTNIFTPSLHFTFPIFDWLNIPILSDYAMKTLFKVMAVSSLAILIGFFFRTACVIFFFTFGYAFFLDKSWYNNHYYLILLFAGILIFSNANRWLSFDRLSKGKMPDCVPNWQIFVLKLQICIVYFYGAIMKLNHDWLIKAQPLASVLNELPLAWLRTPAAAYIFSWGGFLTDLIVPFLLLFSPWKRFTFSLILFFNLLNHAVFGHDIGVFPFLMIGSYILFIEPNTVREIVNNLKVSLANAVLTSFGKQGISLQKNDKFVSDELMVSKKYKGLFTTLLTVYLAFQLLYPLQYHVLSFEYKWNHWDKVQKYFSWTMKGSMINGVVHVNIFDPKTNEAYYVELLDYMSFKQYSDFLGEEDMVLKFVQYLYENEDEHGIKDPIVRYYVERGINGRPPQPYIFGEYSSKRKEFITLPLIDGMNSEEREGFSDRANALILEYVPAINQPQEEMPLIDEHSAPIEFTAQ